MKKSFVILLFALSAFAVSAQGLFDVSRYADYDIMGTARYMALAGSMGAIGGDPSAIYDNPGALGIYRSSEVSFTLNATPSVTLANSSHAAARASNFFFNFNQISYVLSLQSGKDKGYVSSNFSFSYNRLKDFNRAVLVRDVNTPSMANSLALLSNGFYPSDIHEDNAYAPYLSVLGYNGYVINPGATDSATYSPYSSVADRSGYRGVESGRIDEYNFTYAANIGHYLYFGVGVSAQTLTYRFTSVNAENYADNSQFSLINRFTANGVGAVLRLGIIARPVSFLRLGLSFQSPVWYSMSDRYYGSVESIGLATDRGRVEFETPYGSSDYNFNSPLRFQASVGFVIGKAGFINFDYRYTDNKGMRLSDPSANNDIFSLPAFSFENDDIKANALTSHLFKLGAEFRLAQQFSFRAGAAYETKNISTSAARYMMDNTTRTDLELFHDMGSFYAAAGFGYRYNGFGIDITYAFNRHSQKFAPYQQNAVLNDNGYFGPKTGSVNPTSPTNLHTDRHNVVLTLLYKF